MAISKQKRVKFGAYAAVAVFCLAVLLPVTASAQSLTERVDAMYESLDELEERVRSTLMSGGSSPVSFSGEARLKMQYHNLGFDAPAFMQTDRAYFQSGWEGNENMFRLGMIVSPSRNTVLWSRIGMQHTMTGNRFYHPDRSNWTQESEDGTGNPGGEGFVPYQYRHDKGQNSITIHEDLSAGIAIRTNPASFWARMGNTMWTEASPLTIWKAQPRTFAWEYLPFEVEQPIARYYEYNIARGMKEGRAAWNKRPFNGLQLESINLPQDLYLNFVYGTFERYDNFEREFVDFAGDLAYADGAWGRFPYKAHGVGDSYRNVIHGRVARANTIGNLTLGLNYVGITYNDDVLFANKQDNPNFVENANDPVNNIYMLLREFRGYDSVFYKESRVFSIDARGAINDNFSIMADVALSMVDTIWAIDTVYNRRNSFEARLTNPGWYEERSRVTGDLVPAVYAQLSYTGRMRTDLDLAYIAPGFYSPFSFVMPNDAFFAFGSNMVGAGKFMARGEGTPYVQNMMGASVTFAPTLEGYGHLRVKYGQHWNVNEEGRDMLYFPYRLHGADMFSFFHSSFNRWGNSLVDNSTGQGSVSQNRYRRRRLGDESFVHVSSYSTNMGHRAVPGPDAGGLRSDFLSMFEGFSSFENSRQAYRNFSSKHQPTESGTGVFDGNDTTGMNPRADRNLSTIFHHDLVRVEDGETFTTSVSWMPQSRKFTNNIEINAAYDIRRFFNYDNDLFVGGYFGMHSVTRGFSPIALPGSELSADKDGSDDNTLLWSIYARFEPAIALSKNFYLLGLVAFENWRSEHSWALVNYSVLNGTAATPAAARNLLPNPTTTDPSQVRETWFRRMPINSVDWAYGIGFDWDILPRVGLHGRFKWMTHTDVGLNDFYDDVNRERANRVNEGEPAPLDPLPFSNAERNDWSTPVVSLEIKTWF